LKRNNENGILKIEILDSGCGSNGAVQEKLFHPFSQMNNGSGKVSGAVCESLYLVKELVLKLGGKIRYKSADNKGSTLTCLMPVKVFQPYSLIQKRVNSSFQEIELSTADRYFGHRVLIAEDDPCNQKVMKGLMEKLGLEVTVASNGQEAFQTYLSRDEGFFSLMTLDLEMPVVNGMKTAKMIRVHEEEQRYVQKLPIVIVTANCLDSEKVQCLNPNGEIRAQLFYNKPITYFDCEEVVSSLLGHNLHLTHMNSC